MRYYVFRSLKKKYMKVILSSNMNLGSDGMSSAKWGLPSLVPTKNHPAAEEMRWVTIMKMLLPRRHSRGMAEKHALNWWKDLLSGFYRHIPGCRLFSKGPYHSSIMKM